MAIAVDASTPALVTGTSSATTASFTAPADSFLVTLAAFTFGAGVESVTNSGTALTWTDQNASGFYNTIVWVFTAPAPVSVARTVTAQTTTPSGRVALKLLVFTGVDLAVPVGVTGIGNSTTQNLTADAYTSTVDNSRAVGLAADDLAGATPTSSDVGFGFSTTDFTGIAVHKAADTPVAGTPVTLNFNGTGVARNWDWVAVELLPLVVPFVAKRGVMLGQAVNRAANF